jgi:hypothetical protein
MRLDQRDQERAVRHRHRCGVLGRSLRRRAKARDGETMQRDESGVRVQLVRVAME